MKKSQSIACWWLERRARTSSNYRVVYNATGLLLTFNHPYATKALKNLLHVTEEKRLAAVVFGVIDHSGKNPIEALQQYNPWALKDDKIWKAVINGPVDGQTLVRRALLHEDFFVHKACVRALLPSKDRAVIQNLVVGMAKHSRWFSLNPDRYNEDRWGWGTMDATIRQIVEDWSTTDEALSSVTDLVCAFVDTDPVNCQATYVALLEKLTPAWTTLKKAKKCIPHLVAIYVAPTFHGNDRSFQRKAQQALNRLDPMWMKSTRQFSS